jgi:hypothetical protein
LWSAIVRTYERLQAMFFYKLFGSAIVRTCEQLQVISNFVFGLQLFTRMNDCKLFF